MWVKAHEYKGYLPGKWRESGGKLTIGGTFGVLCRA